MGARLGIGGDTGGIVVRSTGHETGTEKAKDDVAPFARRIVGTGHEIPASAAALWRETGPIATTSIASPAEDARADDQHSLAHGYAGKDRSPDSHEGEETARHR